MSLPFLAHLPFAALVSVPVACAALLANAVSRSGAVAGFVVATAVLAGIGWPGWAELGAALATTTAVTRAGLAKKQALGIAEPNNGARGWQNVAANTGVAAWASLLGADPAARDIACLIVASALTTAAADSVASEIGKAWGGPAWLVFPFRVVPAGTSGAVTAVGTMAGGLAATVLAGFASATGLIPPHTILVVAGAAFVAVLLESVISRGFEERGWINNDGVNLFATAAGSGLAITAALLLDLI